MAKSVAVVGGGVFGASAAIELAGRGHKVKLFEALPDLLNAASGINQFRLHRGYHYPRSSDTARSCSGAEQSFRSWFGAAVRDDYEHYYCIANENSLTSADEFLRFCDEQELSYEIVNLDLVNQVRLALTVRVNEALIDITKLRSMVWELLRRTGVDVELNHVVKPDELDDFDFLVSATYAGMNSLWRRDQHDLANYQFELCEKPVVEMNSSFARTSIVILDGPFMCIDPLGDTGNFVLGNVTHALHATNIGLEPVVPEEYVGLINRGVITNPAITKFDEFVQSGAKYIPGMRNATHIGSMFTIRTVLPYKESTDERPTLLKMFDERTFTLFSGKIGNCVEAAKRIGDVIDGEPLVPLD